MKTVVAYKRHKELYWFRPKPYVQSQRRSSACSSVECSEVLTMGYARRVKEVGEWRGTARMKDSRFRCLGGVPCLPLYRVQG